MPALFPQREGATKSASPAAVATCGAWMYPFKCCCIAWRVLGNRQSRCITPPESTMRSGDASKATFAHSAPR